MFQELRSERITAVTHTLHVQLSSPASIDALIDEEGHQEIRRREVVSREIAAAKRKSTNRMSRAKTSVW